MGDRVSIQFCKDHGSWQEKSAVLFSHWDGMGFVNRAWAYARHLAKERLGKGFYPLDRLEPDVMMVDFIVTELARPGERVESSYRLCCSEEDGDNSDNGHHIIDINLIEGELDNEADDKRD